MDVLDGELRAKSARYLQSLGGQVMAGTDLYKIARLADGDLAAMIFHQSIVQSNRHSEFIRFLNAAKTSLIDRSQATQFEVALVPSIFTATGLEWGAEKDLMRARLRALGFKTETIETSPHASITDNAFAIGEYLRGVKVANVILLTQSRGSLETRLLMQQRGAQAPELQKVRGWISVTGALAGCRAFSTVRSKVQSFFSSESETVLLEASTQNPQWQAKLILPAPTTLIQIVGVPRRQHLEGQLLRGYDKLSAQGPSDGLHLLSDLNPNAGLCYPVWGLSPGSGFLEAAGVIERAAQLLIQAASAAAMADRRETL